MDKEYHGAGGREDFRRNVANRRAERHIGKVGVHLEVQRAWRCGPGQGKGAGTRQHEGIDYLRVLRRLVLVCWVLLRASRVRICAILKPSKRSSSRVWKRMLLSDYLRVAAKCLVR